MINLQLSEQELETIITSLQEFYDNETEWLNDCIKKDDDNEAVIDAAVNLRTTEVLLKRFGAMQKILTDSENKQ